MGKMIQDMEGYFRGLTPERSDLLKELEAQAKAEAIPIAGPLVGRLLSILTTLSGGRAVLELGTAVGYSALFIAEGLAPGGRLLSLERDADRAGQARANLARGGCTDRVEVRLGDAMEELAALQGLFDLAFLDFDKSLYEPALPHLHRLLRPGGLLVADNTGFSAARPFNQALRQDPKWREAHLLCFLPLHSTEYDGLSLALRL